MVVFYLEEWMVLGLTNPPPTLIFGIMLMAQQQEWLDMILDMFQQQHHLVLQLIGFAIISITTVMYTI
ncbi:hypothetical protein VCSRO62_0151 [Vibrio cholerae]|nr:hypothetical protein VCSRO62_0151 [Vibrio cholerae]GHY08218.1 hypothetical protein VCSRO112_1885 [Vibrio cholerae]GHY76153.1 hypothetical protein VCSRO74_2477 [Vibrio cholerae]GHZ60436.1 hypothetical protein VCSRO80_2361 [Vibrio cholerae]